VKYEGEGMNEEILDVVNPIPVSGSQQSTSLYLLIPKKLRNRKGITEKTNFILILAENGDIIYRTQGT
jgi:hypothetical protein